MKDTRRAGVLGLGNMGGAIAKGLLKQGWEVHGFDISTEAMQGFEGTPHSDAVELIAAVDVVVIALKPQYLFEAMKGLEELLRGRLVISVAAGISLQNLETKFASSAPDPPRLIRAMPNTPAAVGAGITAIVSDGSATADDLVLCRELFETCGEVVELRDETLMHAFIGVAGSAPAYAFLFAEALADGAVAEGMSRADARLAAAQVLLGAGALLRDSSEGPAALKDAVASPGGTTIEAIAALESRGFRAAVISAVRSAAEKSKKLERS